MTGKWVLLCKDDSYIPYGDSSLDYADWIIQEIKMAQSNMNMQVDLDWGQLRREKRVLKELDKLMLEALPSGDPEHLWTVNLWLNTIGLGLEDETEYINDKGERIEK